jgi:hypothetical protein
VVLASHWVETLWDLLELDIVSFTVADDDVLNKAIGIMRAWCKSANRAIWRRKISPELCNTLAEGIKLFLYRQSYRVQSCTVLWDRNITDKSHDTPSAVGFERCHQL